MSRSRKFGLAALTLIGCFFIQSNQQTDLRPFEINGFAQGTTYHILYYAADSVVKRKKIEHIFASIDSSLSIYKPYSLINRFNASKTGVRADKHFRLVVEKSLEVYKESNGLFDITIYPIVKAWGFGIERISALPDSSRITMLLRCVGSNYIAIRNDSVIKKLPCVAMDVNGIAQGYTVDVMADFIEAKGIKNYLVEVGGELRVSGHKPDGQLMRIGIESPEINSLDASSTKMIIEISRGAVTTSGMSRKQYRSGDKNISHLMNPQTGFPIDNEMISATIIARDAMTADGYDNVLMGLGVREALLFMQKHREMEAYLIFRKPDYTIGDTATAGFYKFVKQ